MSCNPEIAVLRIWLKLFILSKHRGDQDQVRAGSSSYSVGLNFSSVAVALDLHLPACCYFGSYACRAAAGSVKCRFSLCLSRVLFVRMIFAIGRATLTNVSLSLFLVVFLLQ